MKKIREEITAELMDIVQVVRGSAVKNPPLTLDTDLTKDLRLHTDDATEVAMLIEERTGIKPPKKDWRTVNTIGEIIDLLLKYAPDS